MKTKLESQTKVEGRAGEKDSRTRAEIARAIESYRDEKGLPYFAIPNLYNGLAPNSNWQIRSLNFIPGFLRKNKGVVIKYGTWRYSDVSPLAYTCDHLMRACEKFDIKYQEVIAKRCRTDTEMMREVGKTLIDIATRLEAQI